MVPCAPIWTSRSRHRRRPPALCLQILVNAVQVWNARYITAAIDHSTTLSPTSSPTTHPSPAWHPSRTPTSIRSADTTQPTTATRRQMDG
jgi:hypothetical protein